MLLEISGVQAERNATNMRHCQGRLVLDKTEVMPGWAVALGITLDCLNVWMDMIVVVGARSVQEGSGLLALDLTQGWMSMNFRETEITNSSFEIVGGVCNVPRKFALTVA